ncbi:TBC1 domain family member 16 isoform X7 [Sarcophilus harrisii]|uniref:TBC1 domain family member 16 isoform X7 n=1 Tax=Sarcophilus harrisii TaxID=9305 RepID=UPI000C7B7F7C|nr:TBC1 domain family member 16 isoform X7 [Sarcophilus harrisii]
MSLGRLLRRASSKASDLLTLNPSGSSGPPSVLDGEIIYSKNNVCVHPLQVLQGLGEHHPGYLCLYMEKDELLGTTLILAWVPNSRIQRQDEEALRYITPESSPVRKAPSKRGRHAQGSGEPHQPLPMEQSSTSSLDTNLQFPENSGQLQNSKWDEQQKVFALEQICGVFRVDLGQMRSLRLFFSDEACTSGQLVVASRESQYKVFHFHHGGLDKLSEVFQQWKHCTETHLKDQQVSNEKTCMQFSIRRPKLPSSETHPEENMYKKLDVSTWLNHLNESGQVEEEYKLRKAIFFGGIDVSIRGEVWPFLLRYYSHESTSEEREALRAQKRREYSEIQQKRLSMTPEEQREFWRHVQFTVDKDVVRTDRSNQFFRGEDNPNVESMRRILLNYAVYNPTIGYSQGMSDLVAPILAEVLDESDTFWCFVGLMQNTIFVSSPRDEDMEKQLLYLRELLRLTHLRFYQHLVSLGEDGLQMLFCHRWILLCFKREFPDAEALRMWEACWAHYQTDYFHLFICVAIVVIYGDDVIEQQLATDQMLLHFGNLAMHMNGELVLRKARSLLYQFRLLPRIPCSLHDLCKLCGTGMWDSGYIPAVECTGHHPESESCPYGGTVEEPSPKSASEGKKGPKTREVFSFRK